MYREKEQRTDVVVGLKKDAEALRGGGAGGDEEKEEEGEGEGVVGRLMERLQREISQLELSVCVDNKQLHGDHLLLICNLGTTPSLFHLSSIHPPSIFHPSSITPSILHPSSITPPSLLHQSSITSS